MKLCCTKCEWQKEIMAGNEVSTCPNCQSPQNIIIYNKTNNIDEICDVLESLAILKQGPVLQPAL